MGEDTSGTGNPTGYSNNLTTADDQTLRVTYGTAGRRDAARGPAEPAAHRLRGARVRLGPRRAAVLGTTDHTDLFEVLGGGHGRR